MDILTKTDNKNVRRMKRLTLAASTFEEERILKYLFDVVNTGGWITLAPLKTEGSITCDFEGVKS